MRSSTGIKRFAGILVAGLLATLATSALSDSAVTPGSKAAGLDACVAPTEEMRRNHMDYLKHDRDETVHKGIRDIKNSLAACVDCHAARTGGGAYTPVNAEGQFCDACHDYMAVNLTCFQCHSKTPQDDKVAQAAPAAGSSQAMGLLLEDGRSMALTAGELAQLQILATED